MNRRLAVGALGTIALVGAAFVVIGLGEAEPPPAPVPAAGGFTIPNDVPLAADPPVVGDDFALPVGGGFDDDALGDDEVADPENLPAPSENPPAPSDGPSSDAPAPDYDEPDRLWIPSLGVEAPLTRQVVRDGELGIPDDPGVVGRWDGGSGIAADTGTTLLAGHVNYGRPGALFSLHEVQPGAVVVVTDDRGLPTAWRVTSLQVHDKDDLPPVLTDPAGPRTLAIVTCGGELATTDDGRRTYRQNVVVLAEPVAVPT